MQSVNISEVVVPDVPENAFNASIDARLATPYILLAIQLATAVP